MLNIPFDKPARQSNNAMTPYEKPLIAEIIFLNNVWVRFFLNHEEDYREIIEKDTVKQVRIMGDNMFKFDNGLIARLTDEHVAITKTITKQRDLNFYWRPRINERDMRPDYDANHKRHQALEQSGNLLIA